MAITFTLVERSTYGLRYLATVEDEESLATETGIIQAAGDGDADVSLQDGSIPVAGNAERSPAGALKILVDTPAADQAQARALLAGELAGAPAITNVFRGHIAVTPREGNFFSWQVDTNEGAAAGAPAASDGFAVVTVTAFAHGQGPGTAYIDVIAKHTEHQFQ